MQLPPASWPDPVIRLAAFPSETSALRALIEEYIAWLDCDLSFQGVDTELADLAAVYAAPAGFMLVALVGGELAGCVGMKRLDADTGEVKRLYVRPQWRGHALGMRLIEALLVHARASGVRRLLLDAAPKTGKAQHLYAQAGFHEIAPYYDSPLAGTRYFELLIEGNVDRHVP